MSEAGDTANEGTQRGSEDEPLREEDVTLADALDDRVEEGDGLPDED